MKIPPEREAEAKETFKINQFNLVASDIMALNRTLPDYRMDAYVPLFIYCVTCMLHRFN